MNNFHSYITPEEAIKLGDTRSLKQLRRAARNNRTCCNCDEKVWKYGSGDLCFSCTTGESDASQDYELMPSFKFAGF